MGKRLLSVLLGLILVLSLPAGVYADVGDQADAVSAGNRENVSDGMLSGAEEDFVSEADEDFYPDAEGEYLTDEEGNLYMVEIEDAADFPDGYDPELLEEAKEALMIEDDFEVIDIIEAVYDMTADVLPETTDSAGASAFLHALLDEQKIDNVLVSGTVAAGADDADESGDEAGIQRSLVLVRISEDDPYYILDPVCDLGNAGGEWTGFLLGRADLSDFTFDDEFLTEEFTAEHPLSETMFKEQAEAEDADEEDGNDADTDEDDAGTDEDDADADEDDADAGEDDADADADEDDADSDKNDADDDTVDEDIEASDDVSEDVVVEEPSDPDAVSSEESEDPEKVEDQNRKLGSSLVAWAYFYSGGPYWEITTDDGYSYTLTIAGSGRTVNYSSTGARSTPWCNLSNPYVNPYQITKIVIGENIEYIGSSLFEGLTNVTSVKFCGKKIEWLGSYAFKDCQSLKKVTLPSGLVGLGYQAFYNCTSLSSVSLPSSLTNINGECFKYCYSLSSIRLPAGMLYIEQDALYNCRDIYYPGTASNWSSIGGPNSVGPYTNPIHYTTSLKDIASVKLSSTKLTYNGRVRKPTVTVKLKSSGKTLKRGTDYKLTYKKRKSVGSSYVIVKGINNYSGSIKKTFKIVKKSLSKAKLVGVKKLGYTGKKRTFSSLKVKVRLNGKYVTLKKNKDYTIKYYNNKYVSTSKKKAYFVIKGKGNYKGSLKKKFLIVKGNPGLKFSSKKVKRKALAGAFTKKATKKVKANLTMTYKSSKKNVAVVNKKTGKVTPKHVGTTTITVTSKPTKCYKAGKASYKVTIRGLKVSELSYSFENYSTSEIPYSTFRLFFNSSLAWEYYCRAYNAGDGGCCFGLSSSSMMMNTPGSGVKVKDFSSYASKPGYFSWWNYNSGYSYTYKNSSTTLKEIVEAMHVSQMGSECSNLLWNKNMTDGSHNRISSLVNAVKTGKPVLTAITYPGQGGHALVAYKVKDVSSSVSYLYIYDCNWPNATRYITLYKNGGRYTGQWSYNLGSGSNNKYWNSYGGGVLTYITDGQYKSIWKNRGADRQLSQIFVSMDNFEIRDAEGNVAAVMKNGEFTSFKEDVFLSYSIGAELKDNLVNMPTGEYSIVNTDPNADGMEITALDQSSTVKVETEASSVTVNVSDEENVNKAVIDAAEGESFEVTLHSDTDESGKVDEIVFTGEGTGGEVTVGIEDGACVMDNAEGVELEVNGEKIAYVEA